MARKTAKPVEPEDESQEPGEQAEPRKAVSKADAVRQALAAGMESPADGVGFIKSQFGIEMPKQMWSSYRAQQKARDSKQSGGSPAKPGRKPKAAGKAVEGYLAPPKPTTNQETDLLAALETMKPLIAQYGAEKVKRIVDLLG